MPENGTCNILYNYGIICPMKLTRKGAYFGKNKAR